MSATRKNLDYRFSSHGIRTIGSSNSPMIQTYKGAYISLTSNCNVSCSYCYAKNQPKGELSVREFQKILDWLEKISNCNEVNLVGGEPTLVPHLEQILEAIAARNWRATIYTNGIFGSKQCNLLKEHHSTIQIVFHFNKEFLSDSITRKKITRNISKLSTTKECSSIFVISELNFDYSEILTIAENEGLSLTWIFTTPTSGYTPYIGLKTMCKAGLRVQKFLLEADEKGIITAPDLSVPLCIFSKDFLNEYRDRLSLVKKCTPFIYFLPDMSTQSCTAMPCNSTGPPKNAYSLRKTIESYREKDQILKRRVSFQECFDCVYHLDKTCQGGCMTYKMYASKEKEI